MWKCPPPPGPDVRAVTPVIGTSHVYRRVDDDGYEWSYSDRMPTTDGPWEERIGVTTWYDILALWIDGVRDVSDGVTACDG